MGFPFPDFLDQSGHPMQNRILTLLSAIAAIGVAFGWALTDAAEQLPEALTLPELASGFRQLRSIEGYFEGGSWRGSHDPLYFLSAGDNPAIQDSGMPVSACSSRHQSAEPRASTDNQAGKESCKNEKMDHADGDHLFGSGSAIVGFCIRR